MLPGEKRTLLLKTAADARMLQRACNDDLGCFGQLLLHDPAKSDVSHEPLMPILQIMEIRNPSDPGGVKGAVWTQVKCVGTARLETAPSRLFSTVSGQPSPAKFFTAQATCVPDESAAGGAAVLSFRVKALNAAHGTCRAKEAELLLRGPRLRDEEEEVWRGVCRARASSPPPGALAGGSVVLSYGRGSHHARSPLSATLEEVVAERRQTLQQNGLDEAPSSSLRDLQPVWGVSCPLEAEAQLLSWSAFAWLGGAARLEALRARSWKERLEMARDGLRERERVLDTEIRLERALNPRDAERF